MQGAPQYDALVYWPNIPQVAIGNFSCQIKTYGQALWLNIINLKLPILMYNKDVWLHLTNDFKNRFCNS